MAITETRNKLRNALDEIKALQAKDDVTQEDVEKIKTRLQEARNFKSQLDLLGDAATFADDMGKSAGMLQLAGTGGPADVVGFKASSDGVSVKSKAGNLLLNDEGDPVIDMKAWKAISNPEYKDAFRNYLRLGLNGLKADHYKVLQEGSDTAGGFLVPEDVLQRLLSRDPTPTGLSSRVTNVTTSRDRLTVPRVVWTTDDLYTTGMRVTWTGEIPASSTTHRVTEPVFGEVGIPIYTAMMSLPLTNDMVEDASYPVVSWATGKFGETIDLLKDNMIINGAGVNQPQGILINAAFIAADVHTGAAAALTWDGIQDLIYALPEQYDRNGLVVMNKTVVALALSKLQDGDGRPYWTSGTQDSGLRNGPINRPLLGYPVLFNGFSDSAAAGHYPIIFGDFTGYWLVNRVGLSIQVLRELYAETNQILLLGRVRFGGALVEDFRLRGQVVSA